jgi:hypothetical protein
MGITFKPTEDHARLAEAYALDAVDAAAGLGVTLDFSEASVKEVESILAEMHDQMIGAQPSAEVMWTFAKMYGSYVGEVMRRAHGGTWGVAKLGDEEAIALDLPATKSNRQIVWPWYRVLKRFQNGPEDNVWHYYQVTVRYIGD